MGRIFGVGSKVRVRGPLDVGIFPEPPVGRKKSLTADAWQTPSTVSVEVAKVSKALFNSAVVPNGMTRSHFSINSP